MERRSREVSHIRRSLSAQHATILEDIKSVNGTVVLSHDEFGVILDGINKTLLEILERNRYYYGKLMTVRDFEVEQIYFRQELVKDRIVHHVIVWTTLGAYGRVNASLSVDVIGVTGEKYEVKPLSTGVYLLSIFLAG